MKFKKEKNLNIDTGCVLGRYDFPKDWEVRALGDITAVFSSARVHKNEWTKDGVPFLRSSDLVSYLNKETNPRGVAYISPRLYSTLSSRTGVIQKDDILITGGGTIGIPWIVPDNKPLYIKDADIICIKRSSRILARFLYYYFLSSIFINYLKTISHGVTIAHYTINQVEQTPIPLPPLPEQTAIAEILSTQDRVIELKEQLLAEKKRQKKYLMQQLLTGKKRLKGFKGEWKRCKLGEVCDTYSGGTPNRAHPEYFGGNIPWIKSGELNKENIYSTEETITELGLENSSAKYIKKGTLLIAMYGATAGVVAISQIDATINQAILALIPKEEINILFIKNLIVNQIDMAVTSLTQGGQPNFNAQIVRSLNIFLPQHPEQTAIAEILSTADREIELIGQSIEAEKRKKKSLMQLLLTGIVRVP